MREVAPPKGLDYLRNSNHSFKDNTDWCAVGVFHYVIRLLGNFESVFVVCKTAAVEERSGFDDGVSLADDISIASTGLPTSVLITDAIFASVATTSPTRRGEASPIVWKPFER